MNYILAQLLHTHTKLTSYGYSHVNSQMFTIAICVTLGISPSFSYLIHKMEIVIVPTG